jgi:hypothetical protein
MSSYKKTNDKDFKKDLPNLPKLNKLQHDIDNISSISQQNFKNLLLRGENLKDLKEKADSLKDFTKIFKKRAQQLQSPTPPTPVPPTVSDESDSDYDSDYTSENEITKISEYEDQLMNYFTDGHYQYVLDKASQLGLLPFVELVLNASKNEPLNLHLNKALSIASYYGHLYVVEALLDSDLTTEKYYNRQPRPKIESFLFFEGQYEIPHTNIPLTSGEIREAIIQSTYGKHQLIKDTLEPYYYKTHAIKERHVPK